MGRRREGDQRSEHHPLHALLERFMASGSSLDLNGNLAQRSLLQEIPSLSAVHLKVNLVLSYSPPLSIWANFDISKLQNVGHKLNFVQPKHDNGISFTEIEIEDVVPEVRY